MAIGTALTVAQLVKIGWDELRKARKDKEGRETIVRYLALVLQEMHHNMVALSTAPDNEKRTAPLVFGIWDSLFPEIVRTLPIPGAVPELQLVAAELELAARVQRDDLKKLPGYATIFFKHTDSRRRFDLAREILIELGRQAFGGEWQQEEPVLVPPECPAFGATRT